MHNNHSLTRRELEVLKCASQGYTPTETAQKLHISYHTVRNHITHILNKLDVRSRIEAIGYYYKYIYNKIDITQNLLSHRQIEVLKYVSEGLTHKQIAKEMYLAPRTVSNHVAMILRRLNVKNTAEAIVYYYKFIYYKNKDNN